MLRVRKILHIWPKGWEKETSHTDWHFFSSLTSAIEMWRNCLEETWLVLNIETLIYICRSSLQADSSINKWRSRCLEAKTKEQNKWWCLNCSLVWHRLDLAQLKFPLWFHKVDTDMKNIRLLVIQLSGKLFKIKELVYFQHISTFSWFVIFSLSHGKNFRWLQFS